MRLKASLLVLALVIPLQAEAQRNSRHMANKKAKTTATQAYTEMKQMLGLVPTFVKKVPMSAVAGLWEDFKGLYLKRTAIPSKYRDLIALGVAAQTPCDNCAHFSKTIAMEVNGASKQQLREAVMMASLTRKASAVLNGSQQEMGAFQAETSRIFNYVQNNGKKMGRSGPAVDAASVYKDAKRLMGTVPMFIRRYPKSAVVGFWSQYKAIEMNKNTAIPNMYKQLIGLAVSSQIPCEYCIYYHKEAAKLHGATQAQIDEAIAIAGDVRQWGTIMTGFDVDETEFRSEVAVMARHLKMQARSAKKTRKPSKRRRSKARKTAVKRRR